MDLCVVCVGKENERVRLSLSGRMPSSEGGVEFGYGWVDGQD